MNLATEATVRRLTDEMRHDWVEKGYIRHWRKDENKRDF